MAYEIKEGLKYTSDHEWAKIENDELTFGITDFAQTNLGDIVFVELPEVGSTIEKSAACGVIESIKSVNDIYAPASGEVIEVNNDITDSPELLNSDSYGSWLIKIKLSDKSECNELMEPGAYKDHCEQN